MSTTAQLHDDVARYRGALLALDPGMPREQWVRAAMAAKAAGIAFSDFDDWSALAANYDARDAASTWKSVRADGGIGPGTLIAMAREAGWRDDDKRQKPTRAQIEQRQAEQAERQAAVDAEEAEQHAQAAEHAARLWGAAAPATEHPYLTRKGVKAHGLRVGKWERVDEETGEVIVTTDRALLIPMLDSKRQLHSLQAIHPEASSKKLYLKGGAKRGNFHPIGKPQQDALGRTVFMLGEGYATCASAHECTGHIALVCFDTSNLLPVAQALRAKQPNAVILFLVDNDMETEGNPGVTAAHKAAEAVGGVVAVPALAGMPEKSVDYNDLHAIEGTAVVAACIEDALDVKRVVLTPTHEEALGAAHASQCMARLGAEVATLEGRTSNACVPRELFVAYDGNIERAAALVRKLFPSTSLIILAAPGDEAEAQRVAQLSGAEVELPVSVGRWMGWGEYFIDLLFSMIDARAEEPDQAPALAARGEAAEASARDEERRRHQQEENARIQEEDGAMIPAKLTIDEMLERCVWLAEGEVVAYVTPNRSQFLTYKEFRSLTAESVTFLDAGKKKRAGDGEEAEGEKKPVLTAKLWQSDMRRKGAMTRTFKAGAGVICADPEGDRAVNLWRPIIRWPAKTGIDLFLDHVAYLFEDEAERCAFLDWLAHLEQQPGVLPHYGWLHIASHTGCGRNWLASVLSRVWRGYVAPNVDLPALLDSQYNGSIARRVLAIVDEIQEGGSGNRRHTNRLTGLLNAETRLINPKFGRQFQEFNSCRWLVFSNHTNALPIDNTDRRWRVVAHEKAPRPAGDYEQLYAALDNPEFINAVGVFLRERDISGFKPGERPPLSAAKAAVIEASKPMQTSLAEDLRDHWPADIILNDHVAEILADHPDADYTPAMRRAMEEIGAVAIEQQLKINGRAQRGWILRNTESWRSASKGAQRQETYRAGVSSLRPASAVFADAMDDEPPI